MSDALDHMLIRHLQNEAKIKSKASRKRKQLVELSRKWSFEVVA